jgi:hypothetical protein
MKLSTRLTLAMVGLVLFTTAATGILAYRNLLGVAVPRSLERSTSTFGCLPVSLKPSFAARGRTCWHSQWMKW